MSNRKQHGRHSGSGETLDTAPNLKVIQGSLKRMRMETQVGHSLWTEDEALELLGTMRRP